MGCLVSVLVLSGGYGSGARGNRIPVAATGAPGGGLPSDDAQLVGPPRDVDHFAVALFIEGGI